MSVAYIAFSKVFDTVSHKKVLVKLAALSIGGNLLNWIKIFLTNRSHQTRVGTYLSDILQLLSGVNQGSSLAPCYS